MKILLAIALIAQVLQQTEPQSPIPFQLESSHLTIPLEGHITTYLTIPPNPQKVSLWLEHQGGIKTNWTQQQEKVSIFPSKKTQRIEMEIHSTSPKEGKINIYYTTLDPNETLAMKSLPPKKLELNSCCVGGNAHLGPWLQEENKKRAREKNPPLSVDQNLFE
jgi:hypothetical protein